MKKAVFFLMAIFVLAIVGCQPETTTTTETEVIENIEGKWTAHLDDGSGVEQTYEVSITKHSSNSFTIANFINNGNSADVELNGYSAVVPQQTLGNVEVEGTGTVAENLQRVDFSLYIDGEDATMYLSPGGITK